MRKTWLLFTCVLLSLAQSPASGQSQDNKQVELAKQELQRISKLVEAGTLPRERLEHALWDVADAEDDAILEKTLYGDFPAQNLNEQMADDMVAAAMRRVDRQKARYDQAEKLVEDGRSAQSSMVPVEVDLRLREMNLKLARSRAKLIGELAAIARYEQAMQAVQSYEVSSGRFSTILSGRVGAFVASDPTCSQEYVQALTTSGLELRKKISDLVRYDCGFFTTSGVHAKVLERRSAKALVKLLDGDQAGRTGWVPASWIIPPRKR